MAATILQMKPKAQEQGDEKKKRQADRKWSRRVMKLGYSIVPDLLFHAQKRLGLSPAQLNLILQISSHWWIADDLPYPSKERLASRMNVTPRHVQRTVAELEKAGFIKRVKRSSAVGGQASNKYDLSGLREKLKNLAPEFQAEADKKKQRRAELEKRGGGKLHKA